MLNIYCEMQEVSVETCVALSLSKLFFPDTALIIVAPAFFLDSGTYQVVTRSATGGFQAFFPN